MRVLGVDLQSRVLRERFAGRADFLRELAGRAERFLRGAGLRGAGLRGRLGFAGRADFLRGRGADFLRRRGTPERLRFFVATRNLFYAPERASVNDETR